MLNVLRTMARRVAAVFDDYRYAQRRLFALQVNANVNLIRPTEAPDTYQEFLLRTSGPLVHEPPAAGRASGQASR